MTRNSTAREMPLTHRMTTGAVNNPRAPLSGRAACAIVLAAAVSACAPTTDQNTRDYELDPQLVFWEELQALCGNAYEGQLMESVPPDPSFEGRRIVMHVRECDVAEVRIPFVVGDDRSRTWVVIPTAVGLRLTHEHWHADGVEDEISRYGGETLGPGASTAQDFQADRRTAEMVPAAATNVWTLEIHPDSVFVYALRREGTDRRFRVEFDLTRSVEAPSPPWGPDR